MISTKWLFTVIAFVDKQSNWQQRILRSCMPAAVAATLTSEWSYASSAEARVQVFFVLECHQATCVECAALTTGWRDLF